VLVLDLQMPGSSGLDALRELGEGGDSVRTVVLTGSADPAELTSAIDLGARGIVEKTDAVECLIEAIRSIAAGRYWAIRRELDDVHDFRREFSIAIQDAHGRLNLTDRQLEIVASVVAGLTNPQIAAKLSISPETVKHHLTQIFHKTGVSTRLELALLAREHGIRAS
jgi:DNA-binding NarL/FixJ family response regulator